MRTSLLHAGSRLMVLAAILLCISTISTPASSAFSREPAAAPRQRAPKQAPRKTAAPAKTFEEFQVAAGSTLPIELRTRLASNANQRADHVEGRLLRAITAEGVELVPAGATVIGTVTEAEAAGPKKPGRLVFTFHVIEHPQTGSRATIRTAVRAFESERPLKGKVYADVMLEKGTDASVLLLAPLVVRLPVTP